MKDKKQPSAINIEFIDNFSPFTNYQDLIEWQHNRINELEAAMQEFINRIGWQSINDDPFDLIEWAKEKFQQLLPKPEEANEN